MLSAFVLAFGQLADGRVLRVLLKSLVLSLALFALLGSGGWWVAERLLARTGLDGDLHGLFAALLVLIGGWLLWRVLALAVLQLFADEVVKAVELRHYPAAARTARKLGWRAELAAGCRGAGRALGFNLLALPVAAALAFTAIGVPLVFWTVNAVLLGRELTELVWLRHRPPGVNALPLGRGERFVFGGLIAALLAIPFVNLLAPLVGAAMATHLVHRKGLVPHAG
jgi:CysZ protein